MFYEQFDVVRQYYESLLGREVEIRSFKMQVRYLAERLDSALEDPDAASGVDLAGIRAMLSVDIDELEREASGLRRQIELVELAARYFRSKKSLHSGK